tara:strand:- start:592 stop:1098 length:507 start_codon:yes stop_codon:yes gene_type:complete
VKKKNNLIVSIILFLLLTSNSFANKIAFIDLDMVIKKSNLGKEISKQLENKKNLNSEEIVKKETLIKKLENEIISKKNILSENELKTEVTNLQNKIKEFNLYKEQINKNFNKLKKEEILNFFNKIDPLIQSFLSDNSIDILFNNKNIIIGKDSLDITDKIINIVNNNL